MIRFRALLLLVVALACDSKAEDGSKNAAAPSPPVPPVKAEPPAPAAPASSATSNEQLLNDADRIAAKVAELRGLAIKQPIKRGVMNKEQITERLLLRVNQEYAPDEIAKEEVALKRLGLLPPDVVYLDVVIELLKSQIAGFYDPWEKQLYIMESAGPIGGPEVMAHEIDHALQDQHFGLKKWVTEVKKNADATLARQALVEGDGTALMLEYALADKGLGAAPWGEPEYVQEQASTIRMGLVLMADVPLYLRESLVFPYVNGLKFVGSARARKSWKEIDGFYARPPLSTEHIIHPEKYDAYEKPVEIKAAVPAAIGKYRRGYDNVLGEMGLWLLLRQHGVGEGVAKGAVGGWGGDRIAVFTPPARKGEKADWSRAIAVIYAAWDAPADADEFFAAAGQALGGLSGGGSEVSRSEDLVAFAGGGGAVAVLEKKKDAVVLVVGAVPGGGDAGVLRRQVWKGWKLARPR
ncbi:MAG TPA: hypothetical protein VFU21_32950 [Kofleriaceae bacterium]|nr:hypothetical protein [Kofleriaceae bacterium]